MNIFILSCGVFEPELNKILKEIKDNNTFDININVRYLPFGLHTNLDKLKSVITNSLDEINCNKVILLYGSKCHYLFHEFLNKYDNLITFKDSNCMELIINNENKKITDNDKNLYITPGWVLKFDELNRFSNAVDIYDIRHQYGQYENIIIGNTKVCELTDNMIFDLFEKIQVPIEIEDTDINIFKNKIINAINQAINS
ncbi:MAG: DUF1638 domain-containing protein [Terrisporobacter sp.]|uniref:DUF1638 domain-containing protein n=1 Tax=Terrisporobacter sp. TaxID=1965305 RepID=UPI002FCA9329